MMRRFHGIDRHRGSSTVSVLNREGVEEKSISSIRNLDGYIKTLGSEDAVVMETGAGSFFWADKIEARGAQCFIIDPYRFRIIKDSWNKTDKPLGARQASSSPQGGTGFEEYVESTVGVPGNWRIWTAPCVQAISSDPGA